MIGHGRPASVATALARAVLIVCAFLAEIASAQNQAVSPVEPIQLRITWGGGDPTYWLGRITVDKGSLSNLKLLESNPDAVGSIWLEEGQLRIRSLTPHKLDSIEVVAQVGPAAKLFIDLGPSTNSSPPRLEIPLADLTRHPYQMRLSDAGDTIEVQIVPQPAIRVATSRDLQFYAPGEQCTLDLSTSIPNLVPGTDVVVQTTLTPLSPGCRKENPWGESKRLAVPVDGRPQATLNIPLPKSEGVYNVHIVVSRPSGFDKIWTAPTRLAASTRLAERNIQIVVLDTRSPLVVQAARWEPVPVLEIDPTNPRWIERLPSWTQLRRIPGFNHGTLGSSYAQVVDLPLGRFVQLPPQTPPATDPHWQAYSLPLEGINVPHMLEIDYPADKEQHFGLSIVEPTANGLVSGASRDAGVYVEGLGRREARQKQTQRLVFWPRTQAPLLVMTNMHPTAAAHFGQIRVFKRSSAQLSAGLTAHPVAHDRLIAAYLSRPTVAETFGATRSSDAATAANGTLDGADDPETAYESATRLVDYLRYSGYNSAIISIDPNSRMRSTASPLEIDSTELMFRVFDREGISLLPALNFAAPIAKLEMLKRNSDPHSSGLDWVGRDGRTWLETNDAHRGLAPYYNLLDPRVQQAMLESVAEIVERYGRHPAFAGLAIQLSSHGYAQLAPPEWGLDDATFARFARDMRLPAPNVAENRFDARYRLISTDYAAAWKSWRAKQVSNFYAQMSALLRGNSDRRLVLTTENVFADPHLAESMRPDLMAVSAGVRANSTLADVGIDRALLERLPGVVLCPTRYVEPMTSLPDRAVDLELNDAFVHWRGPSVAAQSRAALLYHRPTHQRLSSFEIAGRPWRVAGEMQMLYQPLAQGLDVRQPYVEAMALHDPAIIIDGGERLPLGQEDLLREARVMLAQIPITAEVSEISKQPLLVRTYTESNQVTILAMNMSPWRCDMKATIDAPQPITLARLAPSSGDTAAESPISLPAGRQFWTRSLLPYEICVMRAPLATVRVVDVEAANTTAKEELADRLADLNNRDLTASSNYRVLSNPSFEALAGAGRLTGWHLATNSGRATLELDTNNPQDGKSCLYFRSDGQAAVESDMFPTPPTGQLAMTVYARGQNFDPNTELRLVVYADRDGGPPRYYRAPVPRKEVLGANGQWGQPFVIFVPDLPLKSRGQTKIAFELTGSGEIWLDNVNLYSLLFPLKSYGNSQAECLELSKQIHAAKSAFDAGRISDCINIIDGYWPRFILEYRPPAQTQVAERVIPKQPPSPPQPNEGQNPSPGFGESLKRFLPFTR